MEKINYPEGNLDSIIDLKNLEHLSAINMNFTSIIALHKIVTNFDYYMFMFAKILNAFNNQIMMFFSCIII